MRISQAGDNVPAAFDTSRGTIHIDPEHPPQRLLAFFFEHCLAHYRHSELGRLIATRRMEHGIFVDIGANLGMYSILARQAGYETLLFEPEPHLAAFLKANAWLYGTSCPIALSDRDGPARMFLDDENSSANSLVGEPAKTLETIMVRTATFSSAVAGLADAAQITFVKIDVEGAERAVIEGMTDFLNAGHRPTIWCEVRGNTGRRGSGSYRTVISFLENYGYRPYQAVAKSLIPVSLGLLETQGVIDLRFEPTAP